MKIQSRFRDYYDHISHRFGSDPDCVYVREPFREKITVPWPRAHYEEFVSTLQQPTHTYGPLRDRADRVAAYQAQKRDGVNGMDFVVAGSIIVPVLRLAGNEASKFNPRWAVLVPAHDVYLAKENYKEETERVKVPSGNRVADLVRAVGVPVFIVQGRLPGYTRESKNTLNINQRIPVLKDIEGWTAAFPADQLWQDIYSTLSNVLRIDPDKAPPVTLANDDRIHAAGFDLKTSFRHPVNEKRVR